MKVAPTLPLTEAFRQLRKILSHKTTRRAARADVQLPRFPKLPPGWTWDGATAISPDGRLRAWIEDGSLCSIAPPEEEPSRFPIAVVWALIMKSAAERNT